jgi:hypothetical protein
MRYKFHKISNKQNPVIFTKSSKLYWSYERAFLWFTMAVNTQLEPSH